MNSQLELLPPGGMKRSEIVCEGTAEPGTSGILKSGPTHPPRSPIVNKFLMLANGNESSTSNESSLDSPTKKKLCDIPHTATLKGCVAYVDVWSTDATDNRSSVFRNFLSRMGATVVRKFTKDQPVTHVIFKDGHKSILQKAKKRNVKLVTCLWVDRCRKLQEWVNEDDFLFDATNYKPPKRFIEMQPQEPEDLARRSAERLKRRRARFEKRKARIMFQSPLVTNCYSASGTPNGISSPSDIAFARKYGIYAADTPFHPPSLARMFSPSTVYDTPMSDSMQRMMKRLQEGKRIFSPPSSDADSDEEESPERPKGGDLPQSSKTPDRKFSPIADTQVVKSWRGCGIMPPKFDLSCDEIPETQQADEPDTPTERIDIIDLTDEIPVTQQADEPNTTTEIDVIDLTGDDDGDDDDVPETQHADGSLSSTPSASTPNRTFLPDEPLLTSTAAEKSQGASTSSWKDHRQERTLPYCNDSPVLGHRLSKETLSHDQQQDEAPMACPNSQLDEESSMAHLDLHISGESIDFQDELSSPTVKPSVTREKPLNLRDELFFLTDASSVTSRKSINLRDRFSHLESRHSKDTDKDLTAVEKKIDKQSCVTNRKKRRKLLEEGDHLEPMSVLVSPKDNRKKRVAKKRAKRMSMLLPEFGASTYTAKSGGFFADLQSDAISECSRASRHSSPSSVFNSQSTAYENTPVTSQERLEGVGRSPLSCTPYGLYDRIKMKKRGSPNKYERSAWQKVRFARKQVALREESPLFKSQAARAIIDGMRRRRSSVDFVTKKIPKNNQKKPVIVLTNFSSNERSEVHKAIKKLSGCRFSSEVRDQTTHIVCGAARRTMNVLKGIARGIWILSTSWVTDSLSAGTWLDEESYEMSSAYPSSRSNRKCRELNPMWKNELFSDFQRAIYVADGTKPSQDDLKDLISLCGGRIICSPHRATLCIGNLERTIPNVPTVKETWVLDCICENVIKPTETYLQTT